MRLSRGLLLTASLIAVASCATAGPHSRVGKSTGTILGAPSPVSGITGISGGSLGNNPSSSLASYDTAMGTGVGSDGFAALPLYNPGTDSTDVAAGAPTMDAGACTYTGASRTVTCTATGPMFRWTGAATIGQTYHVRFNTHVTSFARLIIKDENGTVEWSDGFAGNGTSKDILSDGSFVATGHDIILDRTDDAFAGTIQVVGINQNTGGIPGRRFYVNASTGDNTRNGTVGQSGATPFATGARAMQFVQSGRGDQVLYAQGVAPGETLPSAAFIAGKSAAYPFVIQSYDPADPTNELKMGRATGTNRPLFSAWNGLTYGASDPATQFHAYRGLEFNPGNVADACFTANRGSDLNTPDYLLLENDVFAYTCVNLAMGDLPLARAHHYIIRNSALYGQWGNSLNDHAQGLYGENIDGMTAEDSVFWHNGWNVTATRASDPTVGGPTIFNHPIYAQMDTVNTVVRRSVFIDSSADAGELKGGGLYQKNLGLVNNIGGILGHDGDVYSVLSPLGVWTDGSFNVILGSAGGGQNWGMWSPGEARSGSLMHDNVVAQSVGGGSQYFALMADDGKDNYGVSLPNYINFNRNVVYQWGGLSKGSCLSSSGFCANLFDTYTNNLWEDAASGSNTNVTGHVFSNALSSSTLPTALLYADLTAARTDWVAHPDQHKWQQGVTLALAGYGLTAPALQDLAADFRITSGIEAYGQFVGAQDGNTVAVSGLPACVTADGSTRTWRASSSCTVGTTATVSVLESGPLGSHTTSLPLTVYARPVLSSGAATPSSTSAVVTISTNVGSGTLFGAVLTSSTPPTSWEFVRSNNSAVTKTSQAISATGAQTINISGLSSSTLYYADVAQLDLNNNPSLVSQVSFTTTSGVWSPASLSSSLKAWYDPSDITTLFQNAAGTTAVTADGQSVCDILDKSGNHYDLKQATTANCPIYHTSGGKSWLTFNSATPTLMTTTGTVSVTDGSGQHSAAAGVKYGSNSNQAVLAVDNSTRVSSFIGQGLSSARTLSFNAAGTSFIDFGAAVTINAAYAQMETTSTSAVTTYLNGTASGGTAVSGALQTGAEVLSIGYDQNCSCDLYSGNFYGAFVSAGVLNSSDRTSATTYYTGKM